MILRLTADDGELLDTWRVSTYAEAEETASFNLSKPLAASILLDEIRDAIRRGFRGEAKQDA